VRARAKSQPDCPQSRQDLCGTTRTRVSNQQHGCNSLLRDHESMLCTGTKVLRGISGIACLPGLRSER